MFWKSSEVGCCLASVFMVVLWLEFNGTARGAPGRSRTTTPLISGQVQPRAPSVCSLCSCSCCLRPVLLVLFAARLHVPDGQRRFFPLRQYLPGLQRLEQR